MKKDHLSKMNELSDLEVWIIITYFVSKFENDNLFEFQRPTLIDRAVILYLDENISIYWE